MFLLLIGWMVPAVALAAGLNEADYRYLKTEFGFGKDSFTLTNLSDNDAVRLHNVINDPRLNGVPAEIRAGSIRLDVADTLFTVVIRTCQRWELSHGVPACPMVSDERLKPGWSIAEWKCIACHLTGTTRAPAFFRMVQSGTIDEKRLADALRSGHQMSPITLLPQQLHDLALYINSLR